MTEQDLPKRLICLHSGRSYEKGIVVLPTAFLEEYGDKLPENLYLHVPSGGIWSGFFVKNSGTIEGLQSMIACYDLKQYNIPLLEYNGGPHFNVRIFNCYAVEVEYALGGKPNANFVVATGNIMNGNETILKTSKFELEKLAIAFNFNSKHNTRNTWEVKLEKKHVENADFYQVLSTEGLKKLNIDESLPYVRVGFLSCWWNIELVKVNRYFSFGNVWYDFVNECNLSEGDDCMFQSTNISNTLQVVIFNNKEICNWSPPIGDELAKSRTFFLHISSEESLQKGEIVVPRLFMEKYAAQLGKIVKLWMADRRVWIAAFSKTDKCIFGLQRLQNSYSLEPENVMVFQYFGKCTFYLSIFGSDGVDLLNGNRRKFLVKDVVMEKNEERYAEIDCCNEEFNIEDGDSDASGESLTEVLGVENSESSCESFSIALSLSHFDAKSHGVYIPKRLKRFHNVWRKGKDITLTYEGKRWLVKGNAAGKSCRLGKGWNNFIDETEFVVGQCLKFEYLGTADMLFKITT